MRPIEVPDTGTSWIIYNFFLGLLCDLLWSDPEKDISGWAGKYCIFLNKR